MLGKVAIAREAFPYTFPIDFTRFEVGQIYDDTEENFAYEIGEYLEYDAHVDLNFFWTTGEVFPVDATASGSTKALVVLAKGSTRNQVVVS